MLCDKAKLIHDQYAAAVAADDALDAHVSILEAQFLGEKSAREGASHQSPAVFAAVTALATAWQAGYAFPAPTFA